MAAGLLRQLLGDTAHVESAGVDAGEGLPPTKVAVSAMRERGIDISAHRSRGIANLDLTKIDHVLAMTPEIAEKVERAGGKRLRILQLNVSDPYGEGIEVYRSTVSEIDRQLRPLLGKL